MSTTTAISKIEPTELDTVINASGLAIAEGEATKQQYLPFVIQLAEIQDQANRINFDNPTDVDMTIARELRLKTVKIRTGASDLKDSRKKIHLLKGNLEQASFNVIATSCKIAEESFAVVEKAREIAEKKRIEGLEVSRRAEMEQFIDIIPAGLGSMSDEVYDYYLNSAKNAHEAKLAAIQQAALGRIAKEKADAEEAERLRLLAEKEKVDAAAKQAELEAELARQKALAAESEAKLEAERKAHAEAVEKQRLIDLAAKEAAEKAANEAARIEREKQAEIDRAAAEAKRLADEKQAEADRLAAEQKRLADEKLAEEQAKTARIEAELKAAKDKEAADLKAKQEAEAAKIEADRIAAENSAKAPRKQKLKTTVATVLLAIPVELEADPIAIDIKLKFDGFKKWANDQIEKI